MSDSNQLFNAALKFGGIAYGLYKEYNKQDSSNNQVNPPKPNKLRELVSQCSYSEQAKSSVFHSAEVTLKQFSQLEPDILSYNQNGMKKSFIELKGKIPVNYKGSSYGVVMCVMIPEGFPDRPPFLRIVNENPTKYIVDPFYEDMKSRNDPNSYLLNHLPSTHNWARSMSIVTVIREAQYGMSQTFPFKKKRVNNQLDGQTQFGSGAQFNTQMGQNYGFQNQPNFQSNPGYQLGFPKTFGTNYQNDYGGGNQAGFLNPAQKKAKAQIDEYRSKTMPFVSDSVKTADILINGHGKLLLMTQHMDIINNCLNTENELIKEDTAALQSLLRQNQGNNTVDYKKIVVPADDFSNQLIDLVADHKSWEESASWAQSQFSSDQMDFQAFLKTMRKIEEQRFLSKYMIRKCLKERGR